MALLQVVGLFGVEVVGDGPQDEDVELDASLPLLLLFGALLRQLGLGEVVFGVRGACWRPGLPIAARALGSLVPCIGMNLRGSRSEIT